jgi:sporulation protein YlmC with PRC-barrel domain
MLESYSMEELRELGGREVVDAKGESVGFVELVFVDDSTERPEWIGIWSGLPGKGPRVIVPLQGVEHVEGEIRVPWTKDVIMSAPRYDDQDDRGLLRDDPDGIAIAPEKERAAYQHYGVEPLTERPDGVSGPRFRAVLIEIRTIQRRR